MSRATDYTLTLKSGRKNIFSMNGENVNALLWGLIAYINEKIIKPPANGNGRS